MAAVNVVGTPSPLVVGTPVVPARPTVSNEPLPLNPANLNPSAVPVVVGAVQQQPNQPPVQQPPVQQPQQQPVQQPQQPAVNVNVNQPTEQPKR